MICRRWAIWSPDGLERAITSEPFPYGIAGSNPAAGVARRKPSVAGAGPKTEQCEVFVILPPAFNPEFTSKNLWMLTWGATSAGGV